MGNGRRNLPWTRWLSSHSQRSTFRAGGTGRSGLSQAFVLPARAVPTLPVHPTKGGTPGVCMCMLRERGVEGEEGSHGWETPCLEGSRAVVMP